MDELGIRTELEPDALGRPAGANRVIRDAQGAITKQFRLATYGWEDAPGLIKSVTDGSGNVTSYQYDDFGRAVTVTSASVVATPIRQVFDVRSNLKARVLGTTTVSYAYDGQNRLTQVTATGTAGAPPVYQAFTYDFDGSAGSMIGRLRTAASGTSAGAIQRRTTYSWDDAGRPAGERVEVTGVTAALQVDYSPDAAGSLEFLTYPSGQKARYVRDLAGRVKEVHAEQVGGATRPLATLVGYDPLGPVKSLTFGNGLTMERTSNLRYEPDTLPSGPLTLDYVMGASGNVDRLTTGLTDTRTFGYDRMVSMSPASSEGSYVYAYAGQAVTQARARSGGQEVPAYAFGYDQQRSLAAVGKYDAAGATLQTAICMVHDALGRLVATGPAKPGILTGPGATACQREADLASVTTRFEYDAFNRRAARQDGSSWVEYVHDPGGRLLAEALRPATAGEPWVTRREYVWLEGQPLAQLEYPGPAGRTDGYTYYYHLDHLGQPLALTGESGATVWTAAPGRPYGNVVEATTADPLNGRMVVTPRPTPS